MELWDVYGIDREMTGKTVERGASFGKGEHHMGAHVCLFNSDGEMLIQKRQPHKSYGGRWDLSAGGSSLAGENSRDTAHRELFEEIGVEYDFSDVRPHLTINRFNIFDDVYLIEKDVDISTLTLQAEEVESVKWADADEIISLIENKDFVPYYPELIRLLFVMRKRYGSYLLEK
jgi:8-oxo-dGTP pyrophosphatase MutT (NUDIX family)